MSVVSDLFTGAGPGASQSNAYNAQVTQQGMDELGNYFNMGQGSINQAGTQGQSAINQGTEQGVGTVQQGAAQGNQQIDAGANRGNRQIAAGAGQANAAYDPYAQTGQQANAALAARNAAGFQPGDLTQDPGYQFALQQGTEAARMASGGSPFGGASQAAAARYATGLADQTYDSAFQRDLAERGMLQNQAGMGLQAAGGQANAALQSGLAQGGQTFQGGLAQGQQTAGAAATAGGMQQQGGEAVASLLSQLGLGSAGLAGQTGQSIADMLGGSAAINSQNYGTETGSNTGFWGGLLG